MHQLGTKFQVVEESHIPIPDILLCVPWRHHTVIVHKSESIEKACLDRIVHKAIKYALSGESLRKSINFAADTEDRQRTERISPELVNGYRPEYAGNFALKKKRL